MGHRIVKWNRRRLGWLRRIERRYATNLQRIELPGVRFDFVRIADPDWVLDWVALQEDQREQRTGQRRDGDDLHLPYWAELWDSAHAIAQWLARNPRQVRARRVLDLGCGMGLCGAVSARLGAHVLLADLEPDALLFAQSNAGKGPPRVRTRQLNWRTTRLTERFDLILGADILYEKEQWAPLEAFWRHHLAPGGQILLGEPGRQTGDTFPDWLTQHPWELTAHQESTPTRQLPVRLFLLKRRAAVV